jgi:hypothetical protein
MIVPLPNNATPPVTAASVGFTNAPNNDIQPVTAANVGFTNAPNNDGRLPSNYQLPDTPAKVMAAATAVFTATSFSLRIGIGVLVLVILGTLVYFRDKINIGGSFDFLNAIPMSILLVGGGASVLVSILVGLFAFAPTWAKINWVYWILIPILIYTVSFTVVLINQVLSSGTVDTASAAFASMNPLFAGVAALILGCSAYVRAPVISAFPVINSVKVVDDVLSAEEITPALKGVGIGYWLWWFLFISMTGAMGSAAINRA